VAAFTVAVAFAAVVLGVYVGAVAGLACGGAVVVFAVVAERCVRRRFSAWGYAEREDDLLVRRGVLFSRLSVVPYGRMQFIDVTAGPLERSFGLATVRMHTAAAASDARIPGLDREEAARLRDRLAELGEAQAAGL
jgi:membrane protein YdbS with pleckstrin-like domain